MADCKKDEMSCDKEFAQGEATTSEKFIRWFDDLVKDKVCRGVAILYCTEYRTIENKAENQQPDGHTGEVTTQCT